MLVLSGTELDRLLQPLDVLAAVEMAAGALATGRATVPDRQHLEVGGNTYLVMPAIAGPSFSTKLATVIPGNSALGLPLNQSVVLLSDAETGEVLALLNGSAVTAWRTGAIGALGVKCMTPEQVDSVGIVGCGVQGAWQAIFACAVRPIREVFTLTRSAASFERFEHIVTGHVPDVTLTRCIDAEDLLSRTSLIIAATTARAPVLPDIAARLDSKHFISVGSYRPAMQEFPDAVYRLAGALAIDSDAARYEVGDVIYPIERGVLKESDVFHVGELVTGTRRLDVDRTTALKSVGNALYDLFTARAFYAAARRQGVGRDIGL